MLKQFIRRITPNDFMAIVGLDAICFPEGPWRVEDFSSLSDVGGFGFIIEREGLPIGFLFAQKIIDEIEILRIAVLPTFRRHGYADALIMALEKTANPEDKIFLEVRQSNEHARMLYIKHGFEQISERENYYANPKENAHIYRKRRIA